MKRSIFIVGTDTGVGKTVLTTLLIHHYRQARIPVNALKPFCSGSRDDARRLAAALGQADALDQINPWFYPDPVTPAVAARNARQEVSLSQCLAAIRAARNDTQNGGLLLIEGAGGLLSPLGRDFDTLTLLRKTRAEAILTAPDRLGVLNQVFLNLQVLKRANRLPFAVVLMGQKQPDLSARTNAAQIRRRWPFLRILQAPCLGPEPLAPRAWKRSYKKFKKTLAALTGRP